MGKKEGKSAHTRACLLPGGHSPPTTAGLLLHLRQPASHGPAASPAAAKSDPPGVATVCPLPLPLLPPSLLLAQSDAARSRRRSDACGPAAAVCHRSPSCCCPTAVYCPCCCPSAAARPLLLPLLRLLPTRARLPHRRPTHPRLVHATQLLTSWRVGMPAHPRACGPPPRTPRGNPCL